MIFPQKMIAHRVLLISVLFGLCFCDNPPLTMWLNDNKFEFLICAKMNNTDADGQQQPNVIRFCSNKAYPVQESETSTQSCLFATTGTDEDCVEKVVPIIIAAYGRCGYGNKGTLYKYGYKLCEFRRYESYESNIARILKGNTGEGSESNIATEILTFKTIYKFCFDHKAERVVYVEHGIISPTLINHEELPKERILPEEQTTDKNVSLYNLDLDAASLKKPLYNMINEINNYLDNQKNRENNKHKIFLADPADMAFRVWRYPFFDHINVAFINGDLVQRWNKINDNIRELAKKKLGEIKIITGTGTVTKKGDGSYTLSPTSFLSPPVLWKIVYTEYKYFAVAIIVHNVNSEKEIKKLCQPNSCQQIGLPGIIPQNSDNFVECCDPSLITQTFNLPSVYVLTSMPQYQSVFHAKEQKCHIETFVATKKELPLVYIPGSTVTAVQIKKYLSAPAESMAAFEHFCPDEGEIQNFVSRMYENQEEYTACLYENKGIDRNCDNPVRSFIEYVGGESCDNVEGSALYEMQYNLCAPRVYPDQDEVYITPARMYSICYNEVSNKTKYVEYTFKSPEILENDGIREKNTFVVSEYETFNNGLETLTKGILNMKEFLKKDIKDSKDNHLVSQMLVPSENMAFSAWKKATYHVLNIQPMWSHRVPAWNHINKYIRNFAIRRTGIIKITVGVFDDDAHKSLDTEFSSLWWILVQQGHYAIAFLMHNDSADRESQPICGEYLISCDKHQWERIIPEGVPKNSVYCCRGSYISMRIGFCPFNGVLDGRT